MRAYKFLDEKVGIKSLREKKLKISTLEDLNDPFELLPYEMTDHNRRAPLYATPKEDSDQTQTSMFQRHLERPCALSALCEQAQRTVFTV